MSVVDDLKFRINAKKITFDTPLHTSERLKRELLGENATVKVTEILQKLVLEISKFENINISSIIRDEGHHGSGRAIDVGNEAIAASLLTKIATDAKVHELRIDEIIFDASVAGELDRNKWNYDRGQKHDFDKKILDEHQDHIHFAVKAS
jgi:hypothetical protein